MTTSINFSASAALFMDFQNDICNKGGRMLSGEEEVIGRFEKTRENALTLLTKLRERKMPLAHVAHLAGEKEPLAWRDSGMESYVKKVGAFKKDDPGTSIVEELAPMADEPIFWKTTFSALGNIELVNWLKSKKINTLILSGVVSHYVVLATAFSAFDNDFRVVVVSDCCTSASIDSHNTSMNILAPMADIVTVSEICNQL